MTQELLDRYIVPFYLNPDLLAREKRPVLDELLSLSNSDRILSDFLSDTGWRNRVVASTIIGGLKMQDYIDQIFLQAKEFGEFHQAKSYSFALTNMNSEKADEYLGILAETEVNSEYSKRLQKLYKAGYCIRNKDYTLGDEVKEIAAKLNLRIEKGKTLPNNA